MLDQLTRIYHTPADKQDWLKMRSLDITSTAVSALFGLSPYITKFELWHNVKNGIITEIEETERMGWGNRLERVIGETVIEEQLWTGQPMKDYVRIPELRVGTSFDFFVDVPAMQDEAVKLKGILEIKNVDTFAFNNGWISDGGNTEAPPHIELQVQHQLLVSGRDVAYIAALVGGNRLVLIKRTPDAGIQDRMMTEIEAPVPDFARDAKFLAGLYNHAEPGKVIDSTEQIEKLALGYKRTSDMIKGLEVEKEKFKAMMLEIMQDAEKVKGSNFTISAGITGEADIAYKRKAFRNFKVTWRGDKEKKNDSAE
jgi:putative phage-type endonuclease